MTRLLGTLETPLNSRESKHLLDVLWFWDNPKKPDPSRAKLAPTSIEGACLGYNVQVGHVGRGEYVVAIDENIKENNVVVLRTKRIAFKMVISSFHSPNHFQLLIPISIFDCAHKANPMMMIRMMAFEDYTWIHLEDLRYLPNLAKT